MEEASSFEVKPSSFEEEAPSFLEETPSFEEEASSFMRLAPSFIYRASYLTSPWIRCSYPRPPPTLELSTLCVDVISLPDYDS